MQTRDNRAALARGQNIKTTIALLAGGLEEGEQTRNFTCPACNGGMSQEKSFSLKKEKDRILYKCWRASCGLAGGLSTTTSSLTGEREVSPTLNKVTYLQRVFDEMQTNEFPEEIKAKLIKDYGLFSQDLKTFNIFYAPESNRVVFPVMTPERTMRGYSLRSFDKRANSYGFYTKWEAYPIKQDATWMGWYGRFDIDRIRKPLIVVEDAISALKISRNYWAAFLNGTSLDIAKLMEILRTSQGTQQNVVIALDKDATEKAVTYLREYSFFLGQNASCMALEKDLKYNTDAEIKEIFTPFERS